MVRNGRELSPLMRCRASTSSGVLTIFSVNGIPRLVSRARPDPHGAQLLEVYSVTGYLLTTWRSSNGNATPPLLPVSVDLPVMPTTLADETGGLSEKLIFPSGPTTR